MQATRPAMAKKIHQRDVFDTATSSGSRRRLQDTWLLGPGAECSVMDGSLDDADKDDSLDSPTLGDEVHQRLASKNAWMTVEMLKIPRSCSWLRRTRLFLLEFPFSQGLSPWVLSRNALERCCALGPKYWWGIHRGNKQKRSTHQEIRSFPKRSRSKCENMKKQLLQNLT